MNIATTERTPMLRGASPRDRLLALLALPGVTDVVVNGPAEVWVDRGRGLERADVHLGTIADVRQIAVQLVARNARRLDDACPMADARLEDGTRVHAILPPLAHECAHISLRTVRAKALSLDDLAASGMLASAVGRVLGALVDARANVLVTGATGSGKTTLLAALLSAVSPAERIVVIEEVAEVAPEHPHVVRLVERRANVDSAGAVTLSQLVKESLRMRPDRIVLGECRGEEVRDVLSALNTGHRGSFATLHANAPKDVPARLAALGGLAGMSEKAMGLYASAAFDVVVHLERNRAGRQVTEVGVFVAKSSGEELRVLPALCVDQHGEVLEGEGWARLRSVLEPAALGVAA